MSSSVAFFRNLNLGQQRSHSPTRPQLLDAFEAAGATDPTSFQVNGTVVYDAEGDGRSVAARAVGLLTPVCGYDDLVVVRPLDWVLGLELDDTAPNAEIAFFDRPDRFPERLPWEVPDAGLTVIRADGWHAVCVNEHERTSGATRALEKRLGVKVTSRGVPTIQRLQTRFEDRAG